MKSKSKSSKTSSKRELKARILFKALPQDDLATFRMYLVTIEEGKVVRKTKSFAYKFLTPVNNPSNTNKSLVHKALDEMQISGDGSLPIAYEGSPTVGTTLQILKGKMGIEVIGTCGTEVERQAEMTAHVEKVFGAIRSQVLLVIKAEEALKVPSSWHKDTNINF